jgi:hypothetical protein
MHVILKELMASKPSTPQRCNQVLHNDAIKYSTTMQSSTPQRCNQVLHNDAIKYFTTMQSSTPQRLLTMTLPDYSPMLTPKTKQS